MRQVSGRTRSAARAMFALKRLVEADMEQLAHLFASSEGDIQHGLVVIVFTCANPQG